MIKGTGLIQSAGNYYISGRAYTGLGTSSGAGTIQTADVIYAAPFMVPTPMNGITTIRARLTTGGTTSNAKVGVAIRNGTAATMITDLNPTGAATTGTGDFNASFSSINISANTFYLLVMIGAGSVMPIFSAMNTTAAQGWILGYAAGAFNSTNDTGYTATGSTYTGGFASTFTLTPTNGTSVPFMGIVAA